MGSSLSSRAYCVKSLPKLSKTGVALFDVDDFGLWDDDPKISSSFSSDSPSISADIL